jgi:hypothetical protein
MPPPLGSGRCLRNPRDASARGANCVPPVAHQSLSASDQRRAARLFSDPDEAQDIRGSDRVRDEDFWERYRAFAARAEAICG